MERPCQAPWCHPLLLGVCWVGGGRGETRDWLPTNRTGRWWWDVPPLLQSPKCLHAHVHSRGTLQVTPSRQQLSHATCIGARLCHDHTYVYVYVSSHAKREQL